MLLSPGSSPPERAEAHSSLTVTEKLCGPRGLGHTRGGAAVVKKPWAGYRLMPSFYRPGGPPARVGCVAFSRLPAAGLFYAPSRRADPRSRDPRARSSPNPASSPAGGALRGDVLRPGFRSRATPLAPVHRAADGDTDPRATVVPSVLAFVPVHAALPTSRF